MFNVKSVKTDDDLKLYQHQMLLFKSKFNLQLINLLKSELKLKANSDSIKKVIFIQNQIIIKNHINQLYINI